MSTESSFTHLTKSEFAYHELRRRILDGEYRAGQRLPLRELILEIWDRLWQSRRRMSLFALTPDSRTHAQEEHLELVAAVDAGDAQLASQVMERHRLSTLAAWQAALAGLD